MNYVKEVRKDIDRKVLGSYQKISIVWNKYGFELAIIASVLLIGTMALINRSNHKKGSWSTKLYLPKKKIAIASNVKRPPQESKGEIECRRVLENLFGKKFPKIRPDFLRNPVTSSPDQDNNLELDCYNDELKIACEYNGIQHDKYIPFFHKTKDSFHNQRYRDHIKRELCKKNGIFLIEVPSTVKITDIETFILEKLGGQYKKE